MFFSNANAIEPTGAERKRAKEAPPIREATNAEVAGATLRRAREEATPVKAVKASTAPEADPIAEKHGLYTAEHVTGRRYYADYQQKSEVMRASAGRISTRLDDKQIIAAMLDLAEARGWQSVKLSGSESFRREAWVQAQMRGVATEGYKPRETDKQELARRQNALERPAATVKIEAAAPAKAIPITTSKPAAAEAQQPKAEDKPVQAEQSPPAKAAPKAEAKASRRASKRSTDAAGTAPRKADAADARKAETAVWSNVEEKGVNAMAAERARQAEKPTQAQRAA